METQKLKYENAYIPIMATKNYLEMQCINCGSDIFHIQKRHEGDSEKYVCAACGHIHLDEVEGRWINPT